MTTHLTRYRFTVDDYHLMGKVGIIPPDVRTELIDGEVVQMPPIGPRHAGRVGRVDRLFHRLFADVALIWVQNPVQLDQHQELYPDVMLLRPRADFYEASLPAPADVLLIVEVGDTSAADDWRVKMPLYARAGVPELWLEDLEQGPLTVCRDPGPDGYRSVQVLRRGDRVAPAAFPDCAIAVSDLLGDPS